MRFADKFNDDVVGIGSVADGVGAAEKHLETDIGNALAQLSQSLPGIFMQETHRGIKGRATPHFETEKIGQAMRDGACGDEQVKRADARGHERLVSVAESRVGNEQAFFFSRPGSEFLRPEFLQEMARADRRLAGGRCRDDCCVHFFGDLLALHFRIAI